MSIPVLGPALTLLLQHPNSSLPPKPYSTRQPIAFRLLFAHSNDSVIAIVVNFVAITKDV
jgi:hypothetical protein